MRATSAIQPTRDAVLAVSALHSPSLGRKPCAATFAISLSGLVLLCSGWPKEWFATMMRSNNIATARGWLEAGDTARAGARVATATKLRGAVVARSGAARGAGRLVVGGRPGC